MMSGNSSVGSDLSAAISAAAAELGSVRHIAGKEQVLILVSDGEPTKPLNSTPGDTGKKSPTADAPNASTDKWTTPAGAYGAGDASDSAGHRDQYYNFGFGTPAGTGLPAGATLNGIEITTSAFSSASAGSGTLFVDSFGTGNTDSSFDETPAWTEGGSGAGKTRLY